MLTLARHEPGPEQHPFEPLSLQAIARQTVMDYYPLAAGNNIELGLDIKADAPPITGNADDLRILLGNLVDNSLRYTPSGGNVDVSVDIINGRPSISVTDNGPGIPEQERERVFDRFYRCEQTEAWGSGLGLSIAKNIAEMHGARLRLDSPVSGAGLVVTLGFQGKE